MFNKFPFHRILVLFTLFSMSLTACNAAPALTAPKLTSASDSTPSPTKTPTATPEPTNTPDPLAGAPEGATGKDSKGNYIKTVEENGYSYEFTWDKEQEDWVRPLGKMYVWDFSKDNGFPARWFIAEGVPGGNIKEIVHQEFVASAFNDKSPLAGSINAIIKDRLGLSTSQLTGDMFDAGVTFSYSVDGVSHEVVFDKDTGIKVFIVHPDSLEPFVGEGGVSLVTDNISFKLFSKLVGVDEEDELVFVVASPVPLDKLSEKQLRYLLFLNVANFISRENQTRQALTTNVSILAMDSNNPRANGKPTIDIIWNK